MTVVLNTNLRLHLVPAGRRLDFAAAPDVRAYIYRRCGGQPWQCVAQNATSPYIDQTPLPPLAVPEYVVHFHSAEGTLIATSDVVQVDPAGLPASPSWCGLS